MMIRKVAVVGAGMMGKGIAQVCTNIEGVKVCLYDVKDVDIYQDIQKDFGMLGEKASLRRKRWKNELKGFIFQLIWKMQLQMPILYLNVYLKIWN